MPNFMRIAELNIIYHSKHFNSNYSFRDTRCEGGSKLM
jgi:hypothetical protein